MVKIKVKDLINTGMIDIVEKFSNATLNGKDIKKVIRIKKEMYNKMMSYNHRVNSKLRAFFKDRGWKINESTMMPSPEDESKMSDPEYKDLKDTLLNEELSFDIKDNTIILDENFKGTVKEIETLNNFGIFRIK